MKEVWAPVESWEGQTAQVSSVPKVTPLTLGLSIRTSATDNHLLRARVQLTTLLTRKETPTPSFPVPTSLLQFAASHKHLTGGAWSQLVL